MTGFFTCYKLCLHLPNIVIYLTYLQMRLLLFLLTAFIRSILKYSLAKSEMYLNVAMPKS